MTVGQTIEAKITVDATQAQQQLDAFTKSTTQTISVVEGVDKKVKQYEADIKSLSLAIAAGTGNTGAYINEMKRLDAQYNAIVSTTKKAKESTVVYGDAVAAASGGTRNVGLAALEASRAMEDLQYGVGGVVNNIPNLVMMLGGGAGLTAAISLAAVGVNQLVKNFGSVDPATKESTSAARKYVEDLNREVGDLSAKLRGLQVGAGRAAMELQGAAIQTAAEEAKKAIEAIGGVERFQTLQAMTQGGKNLDALESRFSYMSRSVVERSQKPFVSPEAMQSALDAQAKLDAEMSKMAGMARIRQEEEDQRRLDAAVDAANAQTEAEQREGEKRAKNAIKLKEDEQKELAEMQRKWVQQLSDDDDKLARDAEERRKRETKERGQELKNAFAYYDEQFKAAEKAEKSRTKLEETEARKRAEIAKAEQRRKIENLTSSATAAAEAVGVFAAQSAMGQEAALSKLLSAAAEAAGGQIILKGSEVIAGGIAGMLAAPNPASAAQIAGGLGLVAAGAAVQTGGPSAVNSLLGMTGMSSGSTSSSRAGATDRGAAPRTGGAGGGGPLVVNISYGVGGPLPEDTAREVARVMRTGDRRRGAA